MLQGFNDLLGHRTDATASLKIFFCIGKNEGPKP